MSAQDKKQGSISELRAELTEITAWFEGDEFVPDEASEKFERVEEIVSQIEAQLTEQKNRIVILKQRFDEVSE